MILALRPQTATFASDLRYQKAADIRSDLQRLRQETAEHVSGSAETASRTGWRLKRMVRKRWSVGVIALLAITIVALGIRFYPRRAAALSTKDTLVLADFANTTGDPVFDETPRQGLTVQLEQSPFLSLVSERRIPQRARHYFRIAHPAGILSAKGWPSPLYH